MSQFVDREGPIRHPCVGEVDLRLPCDRESVPNRVGLLTGSSQGFADLWFMVESVGITTIAMQQASPDLELSFPQWRALVVVGSGDGIRVGDIAGRIGSAVLSTSRLVRRLERRGLVIAERDDADRRATLVRLTPAGMHAWIATSGT